MIAFLELLVGALLIGIIVVVGAVLLLAKEALEMGSPRSRSHSRSRSSGRRVKNAPPRE